MSNWASGYVSDIEYTAGFYLEQSPIYIDLTCLLNGFAPPGAAGGPFRYCELGCGQGLTTNILAAANPAAEFIAIDFNPAHIATARASAEAAGLSNVRFIECGFDALLTEVGAAEGQFDYVTLHGVYTWVSPALRRAIVDFLRERLRPGGAVYVSYNALPGWTEGIALQRLLKELAALAPDRSDRSIRRAIAIVERMHGAESPVLQNNGMFESVRKLTELGDFSYLAHEYINEEWHPMFHADVARELATAKLAYAGSARLTDNFPALTLTAAQRDILDEIAAPEVRETLSDFFCPRSFRKDVFIRGARQLSAVRREQLLGALRLALVIPRENVSLQLQVPAGKADLSPATYEPVFDALQEGPQPIARLMEVSGSRASTVELAGVLVGSSQVLPALDPDKVTDPDPARRFNRVFADEGRLETPKRAMALAAPLLGGGIITTGVELIVSRAVAADPSVSVDALARAVWASIVARGEKLLKDGEPVAGEEESLALLRERTGLILEKGVPIWRSLGIL